MLSFKAALALYLLLGAAAAVTLDGNMRLAVLILLAGLALKSWNAERAKHLE